MQRDWDKNNHNRIQINFNQLIHNNMSFSYIESSRFLTLNSGTTNNLFDAWVADRAGSITIRSAVTTLANTNYSLTTTMRPADDLSLPITLNVDLFDPANVGVQVVVTGVDKSGSPISWTQAITGTGAYNSGTIHFASINANGIAWTAGTWGASGVNWYITQARWGEVWEARQIGYSTITEQVYRKQFYIAPTTFSVYGTLADADDTTYRGFDLVIGSNTTTYFSADGNGVTTFGNSATAPKVPWRLMTLRTTLDAVKIYGTLNFYGGVVHALGRWRLYGASAQYNFRDVTFYGADGIEIDATGGANAIGSLNNVTFVGTGSGVSFKCYRTPVVANNIIMRDGAIGIQVYGAELNPVLTDAVFSNHSTSDIRMNYFGATAITLTLIDPKNGSGDYIVGVNQPTTTYVSAPADPNKVHIKFRTDIKVVELFDDEYIPVENANVDINETSGNTGSTSYTGLTTGANGFIAQQQILLKTLYGNGAATNPSGTWYQYTYTAVVSKAGYLTKSISLPIEKGRITMTVILERVRNLNLSEEVKIFTQGL